MDGETLVLLFSFLKQEWSVVDSLAKSLRSAVWKMGVKSKWLRRKKDLWKLPQILHKIPVKMSKQILKLKKLKNNRVAAQDSLESHQERSIVPGSDWHTALHGQHGEAGTGSRIAFREPPAAVFPR